MDLPESKKAKYVKELGGNVPIEFKYESIEDTEDEEIDILEEANDFMVDVEDDEEEYLDEKLTLPSPIETKLEPRHLLKFPNGEKETEKLDKKKPLHVPDEIWIHIFNNLPIKYMIKNVTLVSKLFHRLSKYRNILEIKHVSNMSEDDLALNMKFLEHFKYLRTVTIKTLQGQNGNGYQNLNKLAIQALESCSNLRTLKLIYFKTREDQGKPEPWLLSKTMKIIKEKGSKLRHLVLKNVRPKESLSFFDDLTELKLSMINMFDESPRAILKPCTPSFPYTAKKIVIKKNHKDNAGFSVKLDSTILQLERLDFLTNDDIAKNVEEIQVHGLGRGKALIDLVNLPPLKRLVLKNLRVDSTYFKELINNLNETELECLVLKNCSGLNNEVFHEMSKRTFPKLERIFIYIDNEDLISVPKCITNQSYRFENWPNLKSIGVKCNEQPISQKMHTLLYAELSGKCNIFIADWILYDDDSITYMNKLEEWFHKFKEITLNKYLQMKNAYDSWCEENVDWHN